MKLQQLNEYEERLDEASRSKVFTLVGSAFGLLGTAVTYTSLQVALGASQAASIAAGSTAAVAAVGASTSVLSVLPIAIIAGAIYGTYMGLGMTVLASGKQRTLYGTLTKLVKKRDGVVADIKGSTEATEKQIKQLGKLNVNIKKVSDELDELIDFGKGGAGLFRREISPKEKEQLQNIIKAGKGETGDLLSFKYNIDPKKIK